MMPDNSSKSHTYTYALDSFYALCFGNVAGGASYAQALHNHTVDIANLHFDIVPETKEASTAIVSIPRGGIPTAMALKEAFEMACETPPTIIESRIKTHPDQLYTKVTFDDYDQIIITDGIIGTGSTIVKHMEAIPASWKGTVQVFANAAAELGLQRIQAYAATMDNPFHIAVGKVFPDDECEWVNCDGKQVYFVGYNSERQIDYKLPDFGDYINLKP